MKSVYISSTYEDLKDYRQAVADVLRDCGYNVDAMEKYPARDDRPKAASEADVSNCDIYIGIFAWRYGHVPGRGQSVKQVHHGTGVSCGRTGEKAAADLFVGRRRPLVQLSAGRRAAEGRWKTDSLSPQSAEGRKVGRLFQIAR
jgi:hypothetical protein